MLDKIDLYLDDMNKFISMMVNNKQKKMYFAINVDCCQGQYKIVGL